MIKPTKNRTIQKATTFNLLERTVYGLFGKPFDILMGVWNDENRGKYRWCNNRIRPEAYVAMQHMAQNYEANTGKPISQAEIMNLVSAEGIRAVHKQYEQFQEPQKA